MTNPTGCYLTREIQKVINKLREVPVCITIAREEVVIIQLNASIISGSSTKS